MIRNLFSDLILNGMDLITVYLLGSQLTVAGLTGKTKTFFFVSYYTVKTQDKTA